MKIIEPVHGRAHAILDGKTIYAIVKIELRACMIQPMGKIWAQPLLGSSCLFIFHMYVENPAKWGAGTRRVSE
jgi:hypothetical protein